MYIFLDIHHSCSQIYSSLQNGKIYSSKAERKDEIQCPLLFKLDPARFYLRRHMKARGFEIARQFIDLYYLISPEKNLEIIYTGVCSLLLQMWSSLLTRQRICSSIGHPFLFRLDPL